MRFFSVSGIDLRRLILLLSIASALLTLLNIFHASYRVQRDLLVQQTLESNRVYAAKLAESTEALLAMARRQLAYSAQVLGPAFDQPQLLAAETERLKQQSDIFNSIYVINSARLVLSVAPAALGTAGTTIDTGGVQESLAQRQPLVSRPYISATGRLVVMISQPIFAADGRYLGFVGGSIYLREHSILHNLLGEHYYRDGSYIYVVDRYGQVLYHRDAERVGEVVHGDPAVDALIAGQSGSLQLTSTDGVDMLAGYAPVASTGWGIVAQRPTANTLATLDGLMLGILRNAVPFTLLTLVGIWWLSRQIARPLCQLARNARELDSQNAAVELARVNAWYFEAAQLKRAMLAGLAQLYLRIGQLNLESMTDPLTGLLNRRGMDLPLEQWQAAGRPFAVIAIDIDHFKEVNDQLGHDAGDQLLKQLAQLIRQVSRRDDILCRNGGEEFAMLLPDTSLADACTIAERLRQCVADSPSPNGTPVTISLGVAHCADSRKGVENVLKQADHALYVAKHHGRNRVATAGAL